MELQLGELFVRVDKLEKLIRELATWTNFDINQYQLFKEAENTNGSSRRRSKRRKLTKTSAIDRSGRNDRTIESQSHQQEPELSIEDVRSFDIVYKIEVGDDYEDSFSIGHDSNDEEYKDTVTPSPTTFASSRSHLVPPVNDTHNHNPDPDNPEPAEAASSISNTRKKRKYSARRKPRKPPIKKPQELLKCPHCSYATFVAQSLKAHIPRMHPSDSDNDARPFECPQCPKTFRLEEGLGHHLRNVHKQKDFLCHLCPFATKTKWTLNKHIRRNHDKIFDYFTCYFCSKSFRMSRSLNYHVMNHTGERPYKCPTPKCPYSSASSSNLRNHVKNIHTNLKTINGKSGKMQMQTASFQCPKCPIKFKTQPSLAVHLRSHDGFKCKMCSHVAMNISQLRSHREEEHPQGLELLCPHCPKKFGKMGHYQRHVNGHTREKLHKCGKCSFSSSYPTSLWRHKKTCKVKVKGKSEGPGSEPREQIVTDSSTITNTTTTWEEIQETYNILEQPPAIVENDNTNDVILSLFN